LNLRGVIKPEEDGREVEVGVRDGEQNIVVTFNTTIQQF